MSTGAPTGVLPSAPPTDNAGTTHDAGTSELNAPIVPAVSTPPTSPVTTAPPAASTPEPTSSDESAPEDPVAAAIAHLARDEVPRDDKGRFAPLKTDESKTKPAAPAASTQPEAPKPSDQPQGVDVDPYHGFDPRERDAMKHRTRERIEEMHGRWRTAEKQLEELKAKPPAQPDQLDALITEYKLDQDAQFVPAEHLAGLVASQAAVTRSLMAMDQGRMPAPGDLKVATEFFGRIDEIRGKLGVNPPKPTQQELLPFAGQLPSDLQDLVDVYGIPEADVRLLASVKARQTRQPNQQQAQPAAPVVAAPPAQPYQQQKPVGVDMNLVYGQRLQAELAREGVKPEMVGAHYAAILPLAAQVTQQRFPVVTADRIPAIFDALPPDQRYSIMVEANKMYRVSQSRASTPPAPTPPPPATNHGPMNGSPPRVSATSPSGDAVQDAIAYLSR